MALALFAGEEDVLKKLTRNLFNYPLPQKWT
jgi:hypothetical protein